MVKNGTAFAARVVSLLLFFAAGFAANAQVRYAIIPENPRPGEPVTIGISEENGAAPRSAALFSGGQRLARAVFFPLPDAGEQGPLMAAVLAVPATAKPGAALIQVESAAGPLGEIPLEITGRNFVSEVIELNETLTGLRTDPDPQKTAEAEHLWTILSRTGGDIYCSGNFSPPVRSTRRTSFFGDRRVFRITGCPWARRLMPAGRGKWSLPGRGSLRATRWWLSICRGCIPSIIIWIVSRSRKGI